MHISLPYLSLAWSLPHYTQQLGGLWRRLLRTVDCKDGSDTCRVIQCEWYWWGRKSIKIKYRLSYVEYAVSLRYSISHFLHSWALLLRIVREIRRKWKWRLDGYLKIVKVHYILKFTKLRREAAWYSVLLNVRHCLPLWTPPLVLRIFFLTALIVYTLINVASLFNQTCVGSD